jgi:hypothetical protein
MLQGTNETIRSQYTKLMIQSSMQVVEVKNLQRYG